MCWMNKRYAYIHTTIPSRPWSNVVVICVGLVCVLNYIPCHVSIHIRWLVFHQDPHTLMVVHKYHDYTHRVTKHQRSIISRLPCVCHKPPHPLIPASANHGTPHNDTHFSGELYSTKYVEGGRLYSNELRLKYLLWRHLLPSPML